MSDTFEFVSQGGINFKAFPSRIKFTFLVKDNDIRAPELIVKLSPVQARELADRLLAFAEREEPTDRFAMGTPNVDHAGENKEDNK